ncbi:hypothetical protein ACIBK1_09735 [Microbispora rosea]|uniref:hypothetical protein n=1 Tax=Microbispora rosea TaxID=58117 RepID=UPI0037BC59D2
MNPRLNARDDGTKRLDLDSWGDILDAAMKAHAREQEMRVLVLWPPGSRRD